MKSYFAYIRVSTVKQGEQGSSLIEQRAAIEMFAARNGITIAEWFEEMETAAKRGRPEFARLTSALRAEKAQGVILHKIDRGARNLKDWADLGELIDAGIDILFAHEGLDMTTRGGRLAADIQAVVAADYVRNLRDEVRKGFYGRLKQGLYPLPAPRGYLDNGRGKPKTIDPVKGSLVRRAFERYATGTVSLEILRQELAAAGLVAAGGRPLSPDALSGVLRNPFYTGIIRIERTGEVFEGIHEPLIDRATFERVQDIMTGRLYPRIQKHAHMFRRMIQCATCGRSLTAETQRGHIYYRCHDRGCRGVSHTEDHVDAFISEELSRLAFDPSDLVDLRKMFRELVAGEQADTTTFKEHIVRDLALVEQRIERLTDALIDGTIDTSAYQDRKASLLTQKAGLKARQNKDEYSTFWKTVVERFEQGITAQQSYISANSEEKREAVKIFGSNLSAKGKSLEFPMYFLFDEIRNWSTSSNGGPHHGAVRTISLIKAIDQHRQHNHRLDGSCEQGSEFNPSTPQLPS
jgi:DNA invertase Pin-like site-specific DNA recombinase